MEVDLTALANQFGSDKGTVAGDWGIAHSYAAIYQRFLEGRRFEPLRILELGVWKGASLAIWERYFPQAHIIGIDNLADLERVPLQRSEALIGDVTDTQFLQSIVKRYKGEKVDVIIDDASHVLEQQVASFQALFPYLDEGGLYFVEDVSCSRFKGGNRGLTPFLDFLDFGSTLARETTFFEDDCVETYHNLIDVRELSQEQQRQLAISRWNRELYSVCFFHDLCVFEKRRRTLAVSPNGNGKKRASEKAGALFELQRLQHIVGRPHVEPSNGKRADNLEQALAMATEIADALSASLAASSPDTPLTHSLALQARKSERLVQRLQAVLQESAQAASELSAHKQQTLALERRVNVVESERTRLGADYGKLKRDLDDAQQRLAHTEAEREGAHMQAAKIEAEREAAYTQVARLETERHATGDRLQKMETERQNIDQRLASAEAQLAAFRSELAQFTASQLTATAQDESAAKQEHSRRALKRAWDLIFDLQSELANAQGTLRNSEVELSVLRADLHHAHARLAHFAQLESQLTHTQTQYRQALESRSWRLTAPLRKLTALLHLQKHSRMSLR